MNVCSRAKQAQGKNSFPGMSVRGGITGLKAGDVFRNERGQWFNGLNDKDLRAERGRGVSK